MLINNVSLFNQRLSAIARLSASISVIGIWKFRYKNVTFALQIVRSTFQQRLNFSFRKIYYEAWRNKFPEEI